MVEPPVHPLGKDRFGLIKVAGHTGILRAAAGEHEDDLRIGAEMVVGKDTAAVACLQQCCGLLMAFGHQNTTFVETATALFEGEGHIRQRLLGMRAQMGGKGSTVGVQGCFVAARKAEHVERKIAFLGRRTGGGLFKDHMRIGPADAERVDRRAARCGRRRPVIEPVIHTEGRAFEGDRRVRRFIAQRGRDLLVVQRQRSLGQPRHARRSVEMADVGLDGADAAEILGLRLCPVGLCQGGHLDRVAQIGAGAVAFDHADALRRHARIIERAGDGCCLPVDRRGQIARLGRAVVVDRRAFDNGPDGIAIGDGIL